MAECEEGVTEQNQAILDSWTREFTLSYAVWTMVNARASFGELQSCSNIFENSLFAKTDSGKVVPLSRKIFQLGPNTIRLLEKAKPEIVPTLIDPAVYAAFKADVAEATSENGVQRGRKSMIADLAAIAIHSKMSSLEYWELAQKFLDTKYPHSLFDRAALEAFDSCLLALRSDANPSEKVHAPDEFGAVLLQSGLSEVWEDWAEIGRRIISSFHTWPIVVMDSEAKNAGFAVPVLLDIQYDHEGKTRCTGVSHLRRFDWGGALQRAREVAVFFWGNQHNRLADHKKRTEECSLRLDVSPTTDAIRSIVEVDDECEPETIELLGRSLEGCLVVAILNRFLGNRSSPNYAICGQIGGDAAITSEHENDSSNADPRNWQYVPVDGFEKKLIWAAEASDFHTAIVPRNCAKNIDNSSIEIEEHSSLLQVVDAVFGVTWRREKYIGCSDLAYARSRAHFGNVPTSFAHSLQDKANSARSWLAKQTDRVARAPESIDGFDIMLALNALNQIDRDNPNAGLFPKRSFSFISLEGLGVVESVTVIAEACGATPRQINKLLLAGNDHLAQTAIAKIVGNVEGGYGPRHQRFPDVLVVLAEPNQVDEVCANHPLVLERLLDTNGSQKIDTETHHRQYDKATQAWEQLAGRARIVFASPGVPGELFPELRLPRGDDEIWKTIHELSIVGPELDTRTIFGIMDQLGTPKHSIDRVIAKLRKSNFLLRSFEGYFVNPKFRKSRRLVRYWKAHETAAHATVPILGMNSGSHVHGQSRYSSFAIASAMNHVEAAKLMLIRARSLGFIEKTEATDAILRITNQASLLTSLRYKNWDTMESIYVDRGHFSDRELISYARLGAEWCLEHQLPNTLRLAGVIGVIVFACSQAKRRKIPNQSHNIKMLEDCALQILKHSKDVEGVDPEFDIMLWTRVRQLLHAYDLDDEIKKWIENNVPSESDIVDRIIRTYRKDELQLDLHWASRIYKSDTSTVRIRSALRKVFPRIKRFWTDLSVAQGSEVKEFIRRDLIWTKRYKKNGERRVSKALMSEIISEHCKDEEARQVLLEFVSEPREQLAI